MSRSANTDGVSRSASESSRSSSLNRSSSSSRTSSSGRTARASAAGAGMGAGAGRTAEAGWTGRENAVATGSGAAGVRVSSGSARSVAETASGTHPVSGLTRNGVGCAGRPDDARGSSALGGRGRGADVADGGAVVEQGRGVSAVISEARIVPLRPRAVLSLSWGGSGVKLEKPSVARTVIRRADADTARLRARGHPFRSRLGQTSRRTPRDSTRSGRRGSHCDACAAGAHAFSPRALFVTGLGDGKNTKARYAPTFFIHAVRPPLLSVACTTRRPRTRRHAPRSSHVCRRARRREGLGPWRGHRARAASNPGARPSSVVSITARRRPSSALTIGSARGALSAASRSICAAAGYARHSTRTRDPRFECHPPNPPREPPRGPSRARANLTLNPQAPIRRTTRPLTSTSRPSLPAFAHLRATDAPTADQLKAAEAAVAEAGDKIRALKAAGATNTDASVQEGVASLKALKAELAALEGGRHLAPRARPRAQEEASAAAEAEADPVQEGRGQEGCRGCRGWNLERRGGSRIASGRWRRSAARARNPSRTDSIARTPRRSFRRRTRVSRRALRWRVSWRLCAAGSRRVASSASSRFCRWRMIRARSSCTAIKAGGRRRAGTFKRIVDLVDMGDIVGARGVVKRTEKGELSVAVESFEMLTKSLLPLPDKFKGLTDVETRYRQRYVDLIASPEVRDTFRTRAAIVSGIRRFLDDRAFMEMETPVLESPRRRRRRQALQHVSQRVGHGSHPPHRHRAPPQATRRRRFRARVRARSHLPQRGHLHVSTTRSSRPWRCTRRTRTCPTSPSSPRR